MSAGAGATASNGENYYYSKDPMTPEDKQNGQWVGDGAKALGLEGTVQHEDFSTVLRGQDPRTYEQLVQPKTGEKIDERRAYNDYTFSAPKSLSVAAASGIEGLRDAHDTAVLAVAQHMQEHYSQARTPDGLKNGSFVAAKFDHSTSRALDPQLHSHLVTMNMTQTQDGKWRANEPLNVFKDQKALGELYRQELVNQLEQRGFQIEWTDRGQMLFEIKGVDQKTIEAFSQRREAIEKQVSEWREGKTHKGINTAKLYEMAALGTRDIKDKDITKEQVETYWKDTAAKAGTSLEQINADVEVAKQTKLSQEQKPEQHQQERQHNPQPEKITANQVVKEAARILTDKEAVIDRSALMQTAARISGGQHEVRELSKAIESQTERMGQDFKGREKYTTQEMRELEARNVETLKSLPDFKSVTNKEEVQAYLSKLEKEEGIKLTPGQQDHVTNELAGTKGFDVTQGDPGTGKTFASSIVERFNAEVLAPSNREHYTINVAFTGKAASEMSDASGKPAYTIDSFLNAYNSGKIQVAPQQEVHAKDQQAMQGVRQAAQTGQQHQEQVNELKGQLQSTSIGERQGLGGYFQAQTGNISYRVGSKGLEVEHWTGKDDGFGGHQTDISRDNADGSHTKSTTNHYGNTMAGSRSESGTVSRTDGSRISYSSSKESFLGGLITRGEKIEKNGELTKISKTSTFGNSIKGTSITVDRYGNARETKWEGTKGKNGIEITKSDTRYFQDQKLADKHNLSLSDKAMKGFVSAVRIFSNDQRRDADQQAQRAFQSNKSELQQSELKTDKEQQRQGKGKVQLVIPQSSQVTLKVDEASFVGARQAEHLLNVVKDLQDKGVQAKIELVGDTKQMQSIQAGDFFRQAQELAQQGKGNFAALKEINRQKDPELLKVAETLNKDGNSRELGANAKEALGMLKEQGRITEIKDRDELVKATVDRYLSESNKPSNSNEKAAAGEKQSTLLVTSLNKDRTELNEQIREARINASQIERGNTFQVQVQTQTGPTADSYKPGQQIQFTGERGPDGQQRAWGAPLQSVGTVQSINTEKNTVRVMYEYQQKGETKHTTKEFNAAEMQGRTSAFNSEGRQFSAGDRITFTKNDKTLNVKNGQMAEIKSIDDKGNVTARIDGQKEDKTFNLNSYNNVDHGYAVTTEKSQGTTVESVIQFANVKEDGKGARESFNAINVAVTRASNETHVMTTSVAGLEKATERVDEKTTTVDKDNLNGKQQEQPEKSEQDRQKEQKAEKSDQKPEQEQQETINGQERTEHQSKQDSEKNGTLDKVQSNDVSLALDKLENQQQSRENTEGKQEQDNVGQALDQLEHGQQQAEQRVDDKHQQEKDDEQKQEGKEAQNQQEQEQNESKDQGVEI